MEQRGHVQTCSERRLLRLGYGCQYKFGCQRGLDLRVALGFSRALEKIADDVGHGVNRQELVLWLGWQGSSGRC